VKWLLLLGALVVIALGEPTVEERMAQQQDEVGRELKSRERHIDPGELLALMQDNRVALRIIDVREEGDFNLFHLRDAERWSGDARARAWAVDAVKVVVSNDEKAANEAYRRLRALGVLNAYVLAGGLNGWLAAYDPQRPPAAGGLRYRFDAALGSRYPASDPQGAEPREFESKVKLSLPASIGGGCG
jgi:rhodanese-related sulfurtransferase